MLNYKRCISIKKIPNCCMSCIHSIISQRTFNLLCTKEIIKTSYGSQYEVITEWGICDCYEREAKFKD